MYLHMDKASGYVKMVKNTQLVCWNVFCGVIQVAITFYNVDPIL